MTIEISLIAAILAVLGGLALGVQLAFLRYRTAPADRGKAVDNPGLVITLILDWIGLLFYGGRMVAGLFDPALVGAGNSLALVTGFVYWLIFAAAVGFGYQVSTLVFERREQERLTQEEPHDL